MNMNRDIDADQLVAHGKYLENQNKILRQTLWDDFYKAAIIGVVSSFGAANGMSSTDFARDAAEIADAMISVRDEGHGS